MRRFTADDFEQPSLLRLYAQTAGTGMSRARAQRTLGAAKIEADLASRAKTEFLASMSHELRTPLNAIIGFADMIVHLPSADPEKTKEYGTHIASAGRHLLTLLSDIFDIAQIDAGTVKIEPSVCDVGSVAETAASFVKDRLAARHQLFSFLPSASLPELLVDALRLQQALINLLMSASQHTHEGGRIELRAQRNATGGVMLAVSDNGRSLTDEEIQRALAPFAHVQSAYVANGEGMALGLAIAKRLVELQHGSFAMNSVPGEGTRIEINFPAAAMDGHNVRGQGEI